MRSRIEDVAAVAGVSIKTVSRVLNNEPNVRAETRERVTAAVARLGYKPNLSARSWPGSAPTHWRWSTTIRRATT